jgi:hypothetical protein
LVGVVILGAAIRNLPAGLALPASVPIESEAPFASILDLEQALRVETNIVERANIPAELMDRAWFSSSDGSGEAGELGTTAHIQLANEEPIAASGHLVATVVNGAFKSRERSSTLRVRDIRTGASVVEVKSDLYIDVAAFAGDYLFYSGTETNQAAEDKNAIYPGGGLWAVPLTAAGDPVLLVPPEPGLEISTYPFGDGIRAPFQVSATGDTLASAVYLDGGATGRVDVIDVPTLKVRTTLPRFVYAVSDTNALMAASAGSGTKVEFVDLDSEKTLWTSALQGENGPSAAFIFAAYMDSSVIIIQLERSPKLIVAAIDTSSGSIHELLVQNGAEQDVVPLYLEAGLSSPTMIVLFTAPGIATALGQAGGRASATVLDPSTGELRANAFEVGTP